MPECDYCDTFCKDGNELREHYRQNHPDKLTLLEDLELKSVSIVPAEDVEGFGGGLVQLEGVATEAPNNA